MIFIQPKNEITPVGSNVRNSSHCLPLNLLLEDFAQCLKTYAFAMAHVSPIGIGTERTYT